MYHRNILLLNLWYAYLDINMEYRLHTKLDKKECLRLLNERFHKNTLGNVIQNNLIYGIDTFIGQVESDTFWFRFSPPYSSAFAVPFSRRRMSLFRTFRGVIIDDENGSIIIGKNTLNSTGYVTVLLYLFIALISLYIGFHDYYFIIYVGLGYLLFYILFILTGRRQRLNKLVGPSKFDNLVFLKETLKAEEVK